MIADAVTVSRMLLSLLLLFLPTRSFADRLTSKKN